jgi:F-box/leucine-rich repeat protein 14
MNFNPVSVTLPQKLRFIVFNCIIPPLTCFTDSSLGRIAQSLKNLEILELGGCCNISNTGLLLIAWGLRKLKQLNLRSCRHISDVGIGHLAGQSPHAATGTLELEHLGLQDWSFVCNTDALPHI